MTHLHLFFMRLIASSILAGDYKGAANWAAMETADWDN